MIAQPARLRRIGIAVVAAGAALLAAGCAAGQQAATAHEVPAVDANVGIDLGNIQLRAIAVAPPPVGTFYSKGDNAPLIVTIVNTGPSADTLTGISTPAAGGWSVFASAAEASAAAASTLAAGDTSSPSDTTSASASASASSGNPAQTVTIPAESAVGFGVPNTPQVLVLEGLTNILYTAASVPITFTFAAAGTVTIPVPVQLSAGGATSIIPSESASSS